MLNKKRIEQVYLALGPTDLRKSIDGLSILVQEQFKLDPFSRSLFAFCNRKKDKIKILEWDHDGFWLYYKRLEKGCFNWPDDKIEVMEISERELRWLLDGLSLQQPGAHPEVKERTII